MVRVRIRKIEWGYSPEHFKKHTVSTGEVESVIFSDAHIVEGHSGRKILVNKVQERIISVVVWMTGNKLYVITARDANKNERRGFYEFKKTKTNS